MFLDQRFSTFLPSRASKLYCQFDMYFLQLSAVFAFHIVVFQGYV